MELRELTDKTLKLFKAKNTKELLSKMMHTVESNDLQIYEKFTEMVEESSTDWLQKIFQYYEADRKEKKQDYTPASLAKLTAKLSGDADVVIDMCAGSGALTIQRWNLNHGTKFILYEIDKNIIPVLLFNMAVRNIECVVHQSDVLQQETISTWYITKGEKFGLVKNEGMEPSGKRALISNPPFNMKWMVPPFAQLQTRFSRCGLPPESNANYAFILTALDMAKRACFILPQSVLASNDMREKAIRQYLIENNLIESIILCPDKMFESTAVATCIVTFDRAKKTSYIEMMDMRQKYTMENREQNGQFGGKAHTNRTYIKNFKIFSEEQIKDALLCIQERKNIAGYCKAVTIEDIKNNDYRLIPARYIEFIEEQNSHRQYADIISDINRIIKEKNTCKLTINETIAKSLGFDIELYKSAAEMEMDGLLEKITGQKIEKDNYFTATRNKNEIKFENKSEDSISSIFMMIFNMWKQHIFYLNQEENRYLAELRDALLPDLMSGKIEIPK